MVKYSCEQCGRDFSQKSDYRNYLNKKIPCINNNKIKLLEDKCEELHNKIKAIETNFKEQIDQIKIEINNIVNTNINNSNMNNVNITIENNVKNGTRKKMTLIKKM